MTTVLILGAGIMQIPALRIARALGWRTIAADANPRAVGVGLADRFEAVDLRDRIGMLALARRISSTVGLDGVFTAGTDFSTTVSWVGGELGLPVVSFAAAERATDKALMRQALAKAGVPCPRFACWDGEGEPLRAARELSFPLVVKPVDSMGARAVRRVEDPEGLGQACHDALAASRSGRAIIEEYLDGPELSLDAIVCRGEITICGVADRSIRFPPHFVEMGHTMWTELAEPEVRAVEEVFRAGIRALGIDCGAAKGDVKLTPRGPMVGEIAARLSGGYMSGWTYPMASGVEVTEAALRIAVGMAPGPLAPVRRWTAAERAFISLPGVVRSIEGLEEAWGQPGIQEVFVLTRAGAPVVFPRNNVEKCGNVIGVHPVRSEAVSACERAAASVLVRLEPLRPESDAFLFAHEPAGQHPAFPLMEEENRAALGRMTPYHGEPETWRPGDPVVFVMRPEIDQEPVRDWHGLGLQAALQRAMRLAGALPAPTRELAGQPRPGAPARDGPPSRLILGSVFWRAFIRGSAQGVVYLADSMRAAAAEGRLGAWLGAVSR